MTTITLKSLLTTSADSVTANTSLKDAVQALISARLPALPVINDNRELVGLIRQQDCHHAMLSSSYYCDNPVRVEDIMQTDFQRLSLNEQPADIAIQTSKATQDIFPIAKDKTLIGFITRLDILAFLDENLSLCQQG